MKYEKSQLRIGIILNYINLGVGSLIPIFYTPIMLKLLGQGEYGLYKLSSSVTSYLSLISLGLGSAVSRYLIKAQTEKGKDEEEKVLGLFMIVFQIISFSSLIIGGILITQLKRWYGYSLSETEISRMRVIVFLLVCNTALNFKLSPYISIVSTHERFVFMQLMNILSTCISPIVNIVILFLGYKSIGMAVSSLSLGVLIRLLYVWYVRKVIDIKPRYKDVPTYLIKEILVFSFWIFVSNIVNQLHSATDTVMIGAVPALATTGVAIYSVGATFNSLTQTLTIGVSSLLSPRTNKMVFSGATNKELTDYAIRIGRIQSYVVVLIVSGFISFGQSFVKLYAGNDYKDAYWVAVFMMVPSMIPLVQSICYNIIVAQNKHRFRSIVYLVTAIANVIGTWFMMKVMGVIGAAFMTGLTALLGSGMTINWYYAKRIHLNMMKFWKSVGKIYLMPTFMCVIVLMSGRFIDYSNPIVFIFGVILYTVVYCLINWLYIMNSYEKNILIKPLQKLFRR